MNHLIEIAAILWPPLLVIGLFAVSLIVVGRLGFGRQAVAIGSITAIGFLGALYVIPGIRDAMRWGLTLFGFAAPMALGVISIRYVVEET
jgi:hypothetical protein